jgi:hypothetical protein
VLWEVAAGALGLEDDGALVDQEQVGPVPGAGKGDLGHSRVSFISK